MSNQVIIMSSGEMMYIYVSMKDNMMWVIMYNDSEWLEVTILAVAAVKIVVVLKTVENVML